MTTLRLWALIALSLPLAVACGEQTTTQTSTTQTLGKKTKKKKIKKPKKAKQPKHTARKIAPVVAPAVAAAAKPAAKKPVIEPVDCAKLPTWTKLDKGPQVNQHHVFCGEWDDRKGRAKGFHSRPTGKSPSTIQDLKVTQKPDARGIYGARWTFAKQSGTKFSTMFPDSCSREQVIESIRYAAAHQMTCPPDAPQWAWCGPNKPKEGGEGFCEALDGAVFTIAGATLRKGDINTAFPIK